MLLAILILQCVGLVGLSAFIWACMKLVAIFGEFNAVLAPMAQMFGKPGVKK